MTATRHAKAVAGALNAVRRDGWHLRSVPAALKTMAFCLVPVRRGVPGPALPAPGALGWREAYAGGQHVAHRDHE